MLRVYENNEIPKGYRDTIRINGRNIDDVKYIMIPDDNFRDRWNLLSKVTDGFTKPFETLDTITEQTFYIIYNE